MFKNFEMEKLTPENYTSWKTIMTSFLKAQGLWSVCINRSILESEDDTKDEMEMMKNEKAKAILYKSIGSANTVNTGICETAFDLWSKIKENHEGLEIHRRDTALFNFMNLTYNKNDDIVTYSGKFETLLNQLLICGAEVEESLKIFIFTKSLPKIYKDMGKLYKLAHPMCKVFELMGHIKTDSLGEQALEEQVDAILISENSKSQNKHKKSFKNRNDKNNNSQITHKKLVCTYCKRENHPWQQCRLRLKAKAEREKGTQAPKDDNLTFKTALVASDEVELPENGTKTIWMVDSGASFHMTPNSNWLQDLRITKINKIRLGDGKCVESNLVGTLEHSTGSLLNVHVVPELKYNLLSIPAATSRGSNVVFTSKEVKFFVQDRLVLTGTQVHQGLFSLDLFLVDKLPKALSAAPMEVWHKRFAHSSTEAIEKLIKNKSVEGLKIQKEEKQECLSCTQGKICRTHHKTRVPKNIETGLILHLDTFGPVRTPSLGQSKFAVIAVEQHSAYKFIEFTKTKEDIPDRVKQIITKSELLSNKYVKLLCSDNGTEFKNQKLTNWTEEKGIVLSYSAPHVPQQNGTAERAIRTITELAIAMLNDSNLPRSLWPYGLQNSSVCKQSTHRT